MEEDKEVFYTDGGVYVAIRDCLGSNIGYMKIEDALGLKVTYGNE